MSIRKARRRYVKPEDECEHASCPRNKMEASKTDAWSLLGLCRKHVKDAQKLLSG